MNENEREKKGRRAGLKEETVSFQKSTCDGWAKYEKRRKKRFKKKRSKKAQKKRGQDCEMKGKKVMKGLKVMKKKKKKKMGGGGKAGKNRKHHVVIDCLMVSL